MKQAFHDYLKPIIAQENAKVAEQRRQLQAWSAQLNAGDALGFFERRSLSALADTYRVDTTDQTSEQLVTALLLRVDEVPEALVLAQAAKESGWGRSRFAVEGNNLFGQWCYEPGCGIVPRNRAAGKRHEVADFDTPADAVASYLQNLNSHHSYRGFRQRRAALRRADKPLDPILLASELTFYSERREAYVVEIQSMVRQFQRIAREDA
jgi:Bax protein